MLNQHISKRLLAKCDERICLKRIFISAYWNAEDKLLCYNFYSLSLTVIMWCYLPQEGSISSSQLIFKQCPLLMRCYTKGFRQSVPHSPLGNTAFLSFKTKNYRHRLVHLFAQHHIAGMHRATIQTVLLHDPYPTLPLTQSQNTVVGEGSKSVSKTQEIK